MYRVSKKNWDSLFLTFLCILLINIDIWYLFGIVGVKLVIWGWFEGMRGPWEGVRGSWEGFRESWEEVERDWDEGVRRALKSNMWHIPGVRAVWWVQLKRWEVIIELWEWAVREYEGGVNSLYFPDSRDVSHMRVLRPSHTSLYLRALLFPQTILIWPIHSPDSKKVSYVYINKQYW